MTVYRSPGKTGPLDEWMIVVEGRRTTEYAWRWIGPNDYGPNRATKRTHRDDATAQAVADAAVAAKTAAGWRPIAKWPAGTRAPVSSQPAPHPFRQPGTSPCREQRFSLDGTTEIASTWSYSHGWNRDGLKYKLTKHATLAKARASVETKAAALVAEGWVPVPKWPWPPKQKAKPVVVAPKPKKVDAKPDPAWKKYRVTRVTAVGPKAPVAKARDLAEIARVTGHAPPSDWVALVTKHGAREFAGRMQFLAADKVLAFSKKWRGWWKPGSLESHWPNLATLAPDLKRLVLVASTYEGDQIGYVAGTPGYLLLGRNQARAIALADLPAVLGYANAVNVNAGDRVSLRYSLTR